MKLVAEAGVAPAEAELMRLARISFSPQLKLVESVGNAPTSACLQGKCIACLPRPHMNVAATVTSRKMAGRLGAAPSKLSFGDSAARAGARPVENVGREVSLHVPPLCHFN